jgi:hypothetical protein
MQQGTPIFHSLIKKMIECLEKHNLLIFLKRKRIVTKQILMKHKRWNLGCYRFLCHTHQLVHAEGSDRIVPHISRLHHNIPILHRH